MKKIFRISRWEETEEGFVEIEPLKFEFGVCMGGKCNKHLILCINGFQTERIILGNLGQEDVNKTILKAYKSVLDGKYTKKGVYLKPSKILELTGNYYFNLLLGKYLVDKKCKKRDLVVEIFGKHF